MNVFLSLLCALGIAAGQQPLSVNQAFTDHMVLQREKPVAVYGQGKAGSTVTVKFMDQEKSAVVDKNGRWLVRLDAMKAVFEGQELGISSSLGEKLSVKDVLVGEVWLTSGQSNMEMGLTEVENGAAEAACATDSFIRIFEPAVRARYLMATDLAAAWRVCSPEEVKKGAFGGFGAIAYYFAKNLRQELKVPVGVMNSCWGGTPIVSYIPEESFAEYKTLAGCGEYFKKIRSTYEWEVRNYMQSAQSWIEKTKKSLAEGHAEMEGAPAMPKNPEPKEPCIIYNAMIAPLVPYTIRGFLWYQGEYEVIERPCGKSYYEKMHALVESWRKLWGEELPFYYVQIAPWSYKGLYDYRMEIVDAQTRALDIPKTGVALTYDLVKDLGNIHPVIKKPLADRLAGLALKEVYGFSNLKPYTPFMKKVKIGTAEAKVYFSNAYDGLKTADGKDPDMFEVAGADGKFVPAVAEITGKDEITLTSAELNEIKYVQFARDYVAQPNLRNSAGLPACTFTTYVPREKTLTYQQKAQAKSFCDATSDYLVDGRTDRGYGWISEEVNGGLAEITLEEAAYCDTVVVCPFCDNKDWQRFNVYVKNEDGSWEKVGGKDDHWPSKERETYNFKGRKITGIKLEVLQTRDWQRARFHEILAYASKPE